MISLSLPAEGAAAEQAVAKVEAKPLAEVLNTQKLYSKDKIPPAPRFGVQYNWKVSEDFIPPNDGKLNSLLNIKRQLKYENIGSYFPMRVFN